MSWDTLDFGEAVQDVTSGNTKIKTRNYLLDGAYPIIDQGQNLIGGYTDEPSHLQKNDLPITIFGDHTRIFKFIDFPFCLGADGTKALKPKHAGLDAKFLFHFLNSVSLPNEGYSRHFKFLKEVKIPLPPLTEQKRIVAILDQADALRRKRQQALDHLGQLGQSIFYEMFGENSARCRELRELGSVITGRTPPTKHKEYFGGSVPFITPGDLETDGPVNRTLTEQGATHSKTVEKGSAFVCCIGATIGKMGQANEKSAFNQQINAVEWSDEIAPSFGLYALMRKKPDIIHAGTGSSTTLPIMKKSLFERIEIGVPERSQQRLFSEKVAQSRLLIRDHEEALTQSGRLFASLQQRAFRGDL